VSVEYNDFRLDLILLLLNFNINYATLYILLTNLSILI